MTNLQFESTGSIRYEGRMLDTLNSPFTTEPAVLKTIFEDLISPLSVKEFQDQYLFKQPYAAPSKAERFQNLISWMLLWEIFSSGHKDCWLPKHGALPEDPQLNTGNMSIEQARKGFSEGRTVLVRHAERAHPLLAAIARDFHGVFRDPIDIQIYCTPAGEEGFDWHYDAEEVFVIQSAGEKEFRLRKNTINPNPLYSRVPRNMRFEQEPPAQEIRCLLKAGDWLYIPSGWWHKARAITPSFHLSVGVMAMTGFSFLESLLPRLAENPLWRERLPLRGPLNQMADEEKRKMFHGLLKTLNDSLSTLLTSEDILMSGRQGPSRH